MEARDFSRVRLHLSKDTPEDVARKIVSIFEEGSKCSNDEDKTDKNNEKNEYHNKIRQDAAACSRAVV